MDFLKGLMKIFFRAKTIVGLNLIVAIVMLCSFSVNGETKADEAASQETAKELTVTAKASDKSNLAPILDKSYATTCTFSGETVITITGNEPIGHLYIQWAKIPAEWKLEYTNGGEQVISTCGTQGFLHEYVAVGGKTGNVDTVTLRIPAGSSICNIRVFGLGSVPGTVQVWKPHCKRADMLVLSTHADDEILFLGGVLATYAGGLDLDVQVIYFSDYTNAAVVREHEKLDGLWTVGVRNYPENGSFDDIYAADLAVAESTFGYDKTLAWVVEMIRKYQPQVCVGQDTNGEYGHGTHQLTSKALQEAVTISNRADSYPETAAKYGVWDVPKTYIHLYGENKITLNCREKLDGSKEGIYGDTALNVATRAYKQHVSQQWCWFYVSDDYRYSISEFGLARTTVGPDTGNDMMENIVPYSVQEYEEEMRRQEESRQQESREEQSRQEAEHASVLESESIQKEQEKKEAQGRIIRIIVFAAVAVCLMAAAVMAAFAMRERRRRQRRKAARKKAAQKRRRQE